MLTGKKIRALFFGILILASVSIFFPGSTKALTASDFTLNTSSITGATVGSGDGGEVQAAFLPVQYKQSPAENTRDFADGKFYYITDGKTYNVYKKGNLDVANGAGRDASKDTLVGVLTSDGQYRELKTPILKNEFAAQEDAVNSAAKLAGDNYAAWDATMAKDDSYIAGKAEQERIREIQNEQIALQARADAGQASEADKARLAALNTEVAALKESNKTRDFISAQTSRSGRETGRPTSEPEQIYCFNFSVQGWWSDKPPVNMAGCAAIALNFTMKVAAFFLWTAALLFDFTLGITLNIRPLVEQLAIVNIGWGIFRDISNLFFIFLLLFAAIGTIVNSGKFNAKAMVPSILVAALLINFSLFFTKVIIDTSNIMALQFYANMGGGQTILDGNPLSSNVNTKDSKANGIAAIFLKSMNLENLYTISTTDVSNSKTGAVTGVAGGQSAGLSAYNIALVELGGTILFLVTAFVLFAATALFIIRTIILIGLMTTSPIAFLAKAIPGGKLKALGDKWWDNLWKQVFFAPIYMALMYIAVVAVRSLGSAGVGTNGSWTSMFNGDSSSINVVFTFVMIIGFMVFALVSAQSMGAVGASTAVGMGKKLQGWGLGALKASTIGVAGGAAGFAAKGIIGSAAYSMANSNGMRKFVSRLPGGGLVKSGFDSIASAKFGTKKGYAQSVTDRRENREKLAEFAGGSQEFRNRSRGESLVDYERDREVYLKSEKDAAAIRKSATLGIEVNAKGEVLGTSATPLFTTKADVHGRRQAQQKHLTELKKKGKAAVDKVTRKKGYLESVEEIVGKPAMEAHFGPKYQEKTVDTQKIVDFKKGITNGTVAYDNGSKLHKLLEDIDADEKAINNAGTQGEIAKISTRLNNYYKRKEALEEKISTHLDAVDKLQQEVTT